MSPSRFRITIEISPVGMTSIVNEISEKGSVLQNEFRDSKVTVTGGV